MIKQHKKKKDMKIQSKHTNVLSLLGLIRKLYLKKMLLIVQLIVLSFFITSCSNTDVGIHYYALNTIEAEPKKLLIIENSTEHTFVIIEQVALADFLNTGSLVMQIDSHQIQLSNQHRWADKLPKAISTHLTSSLLNSNNSFYVEDKSTKNETLADHQLALNFEQFTITNHHETIISGYYRIQSKLNGESKKSFFDIRQPLTQDGYNHAVAMLKKSLDELSEQIVKDIH